MSANQHDKLGSTRSEPHVQNASKIMKGDYLIGVVLPLATEVTEIYREVESALRPYMSSVQSEQRARIYICEPDQAEFARRSGNDNRALLELSHAYARWTYPKLRYECGVDSRGTYFVPKDVDFGIDNWWLGGKWCGLFVDKPCPIPVQEHPGAGNSDHNDSTEQRFQEAARNHYFVQDLPSEVSAHWGVWWQDGMNLLLPDGRWSNLDREVLYAHGEFWMNLAGEVDSASVATTEDWIQEWMGAIPQIPEVLSGYRNHLIVPVHCIASGGFLSPPE